MKDAEKKDGPNVIEERPETARPKFGISSLISRMSKSENSNLKSGTSRNEPNFNASVTKE